MERLPVETPAFLYDEVQIEADCLRVARMAHEVGCQILFAVKALSIAGALKIVGRHVNGFSTSSLFETLLIREIFGRQVFIHTTCPGLREQDIPAIIHSSRYFSCNSISQFERLASNSGCDLQLGIRVNPGLSLLADPRYDPCRRHSKLGASPQEISNMIGRSPELANRLNGLLVHNNCDADEFSGLLQTVKCMAQVLSTVLPSLSWINLGGGYVFRKGQNMADFCEAIAYLQSRSTAEVFIEPGAALVRSGVQLIASVVDLFERDGKMIAMLDTSVNHMPEVFEYQDVPDNEPWVLGHVHNGSFTYLLAGNTCLAGDVFGDYSFENPIEIGDQIIFPEVGAYSFVKANWFNGIGLPSIYAKSADGKITLMHRFTFTDFAIHNALQLGGEK